MQDIQQANYGRLWDRIKGAAGKGAEAVKGLLPKEVPTKLTPKEMDIQGAGEGGFPPAPTPTPTPTEAGMPSIAESPSPAMHVSPTIPIAEPTPPPVPLLTPQPDLTQPPPILAPDQTLQRFPEGGGGFLQPQQGQGSADKGVEQKLDQLINLTRQAWT